MSSFPTIAGAFSKIYVGDFGSSSKLTWISSIRTKDITPSAVAPKEYLNGMNIYAQTGNQVIKFDVHYYTDLSLPHLLCRNLSITGAITDAPDPSRKYIVLLLNTDTTKYSYLFPQISVQLDMDTNYEKERPTEITNKFFCEHPNLDYKDPTLNCHLIQPGTPTALKAILGGLSPY